MITRDYNYTRLQLLPRVLPGGRFWGLHANRESK